MGSSILNVKDSCRLCGKNQNQMLSIYANEIGSCNLEHTILKFLPFINVSIVINSDNIDITLIWIDILIQLFYHFSLIKVTLCQNMFAVIVLLLWLLLMISGKSVEKLMRN